MKKLLAALFAALMLVALTACDGSTKPIDVDMTDPAPTPAESEQPQTGTLTLEYADKMGMVAAGSIHSLGVRTDGTVLSAGHDYYGQRKTSDWADVVYVAAGKTVSLGVKADGTMLVTGTLPDDASLEAVKGWTDVFMADAGEAFAVALKKDGTVVAAGDNSKNQCDVTAWKDIVYVACGDAFTVGLTSSGELVATPGAPDVASFGKVKAVAAGGDAGVVALNEAGALVGTVDVTAFAGLDIKSFGVDDSGVVVVTADGKVKAAFAEGIAPDPNYAQGTVDFDIISNGVSVAVGEKHAVVLRADGTAAAYGVNDDLQCDVGRFNLRPYIESSESGDFVRGLQLGMTVAEAKPYIAAIRNSEAIAFVKVTVPEGGEPVETPCADTDIIASGVTVKDGDTVLGEIALMGDIDGDGAVTEADKAIMDKYIEESSSETYVESTLQLTGGCKRALLLERNTAGNLTCTETSAELLAGAIAGTPLAQFDKRDTNVYRDQYNEAKGKNADTVGYIEIAQTNISYPIMFDAAGEWYYNNHTFEKKKEESGSIYAYYFANPHPQNTVVTGHNSRPSGSMFHQLHHIQEFNLGETNCAQKKYCGVELTNLPDLKIYSNRVWTLYLFGEETEWEMFSMYETEPGQEAKEIWLDNIWWRWGDNARPKEGDRAAVETWLAKQIERTSIPFDTTVTADDQFLTIFTCGNEHDDATAYARLYMMFKRVN